MRLACEQAVSEANGSDKHQQASASLVDTFATPRNGNLVSSDAGVENDIEGSDVVIADLHWLRAGQSRRLLERTQTRHWDGNMDGTGSAACSERPVNWDRD